MMTWNSRYPVLDPARPGVGGFAAAFLTLLAIAGCAASPRASTGRSSAMTVAQPAIELLGFQDCPNTPIMRERLRAALESIGEGWTFADTDQETLPESDLRRGWPTPTVLVNGNDLFGMPAPIEPTMMCRLYPGGVPDATVLADAIRSAVSRSIASDAR